MTPRYDFRFEITGYDLIRELFDRADAAFHAHMQGEITFEEYRKISETHQIVSKAFDELVPKLVKPKNETMELAAL